MSVALGSNLGFLEVDSVAGVHKDVSKTGALEREWGETAGLLDSSVAGA
jgi:hypothetical protein